MIGFASKVAMSPERYEGAAATVASAPTIRSSLLISAACAALLSALAFESASPASAQGYFTFGTYSNEPYSAKPRKLRQKISKSAAQAKAAKQEAAVIEPKPEGPLVISVSLRKQRVAVFDADGLVTEAPISSGTIGRPTPTGVFSVLEKNRVHYSNLYDSAPMPNMHRITWSGVALHAGHLPGYPASHGCIRLPHGFSKKLFDITKVGTRVIVSNDPVVPQKFTHDALFKAYPPENAVAHALVPGSGTKVADASNLTTGATSAASEIIGVTSAAAAEAPKATDSEPLVRQKWRAEQARLADAVITSGTAKTAAGTALAEANKAIGEAKVKLKQVRDEANKVTAEAKSLSNKSQSAEKQLEAFEKKLAKATGITPDAAVKATADEDKLEANALDLADAAEDAAKEAKEMSQLVADAEKQLADAEADRTAKSVAYNQAGAAFESAKSADAAAKRREAKRKNMVHVFVSRKTGRLYVRQGYEPILEAPVQFTNPDQPIGTHIFTALSVADNNRDVTWNVASVPTKATAKVAVGKNKKQREEMDRVAALESAEALSKQTPQAALDSFTIAQDVRDQIEDVMKPGSSLIVSDNGLSNETGKFTDFIVPVR